MRKRVWIFGLVFMLLMSAVIIRLFWLSIIDGSRLSAMALDQQTKSFDYHQYSRGDFLDSKGRNITGVVENCLVIFPAMLEDAQFAAEALSGIIDSDPEQIIDRLPDEQGVSSEPFILKTGLTRSQAEQIEQAGIRGIIAMPLAARYGCANEAVHLLGQVQRAADGSYTGIGGLEEIYDSYLNERNDIQVIAYVDAKGNLTADDMFLSVPPEPYSCSIGLTIDLDYQQIACNALSGYSGACIILDPYNGDILASVSSPDYDPYGWAPLAAPDVYVNKAFSLYPPASTFKTVLAAAALEKNILPVNEKGEPAADGEFICDGAYTLPGGYDVSCWKKEGHGKIGLDDALANSCNCYFIGLGLAMGGDMIKEYSARFGLYNTQIIGSSSISAGQTDFDNNTKGDIANASIGEKGIRISPLHSAVMMAVCVNGGKTVTPRLVREAAGADGIPLESFYSAAPVQSINEQTAQKLRQMLVRTVDEGTGVNAQGEHISCGGKTGTSQDAGVWFCGFAPAEGPKWVISIYVENASSGGAEAAEIFSSIADRLALLEGEVP